MHLAYNSTFKLDNKRVQENHHNNYIMTHFTPSDCAELSNRSTKL